MTTSASFTDFCKFIVSKKDSDDFDIDCLVDCFINFIEPFSSENNIDLPEEFIDLIECIDDDEDSEEEASSE